MDRPGANPSCAEEAHTDAEPSGAEDFAYWFEVVRDWSGSAFLAGEKVENEHALKAALYGDLCRLGNHLMAWRDEGRKRGRGRGVSRFADHLDAVTKKTIRRSLDNIEAALARRFGGTAEATAWLIESPPSPNHRPRWWHPVRGWTVDPNRALRLSRREDAEAIIGGGNVGFRGIATEHMWFSQAEGEAKAARAAQNDGTPT